MDNIPIFTKKMAQFKNEGFKGQQSLVLPESVVEQVKKNNLICEFMITDIGFYPQAEFHYKERRNGASGNIIIYCVDGSGWCEAQGERRKIQRHDVCIIPAGVPHKYGADPKKPWTIYWLHIEGDKANQLAGNKTYTIQLLNEEPELYLQRIRLFDEIFSRISITSNMRNLEYANMLAWNFLATLFYHDLLIPEITAKGKSLIDCTIDYMRNNLDKNLTLTDFSKQAGLSISQFSNIFKQKTSTSPMSFYMQLKIQKSVQLMENPNKRIKEIAMELGLEDPFYFSRIFTRVMGMSPANFKRIHMYS
jgi:AraC family transcriptional regulator, arabinose operon regulatory protein